MNEYRGPRGVPDIVPPDSELLSELEGVARVLFDRYGYRRIELPAFEHTEVFTRSMGESSDVLVQKQMYVFTDSRDRSFALRPEGTAGVVRALVEHRLDAALGTPVRLSYFCPFFRYERPQKGRSRQFFQVGVEAIGSSSPVVDAEVIFCGVQFFQALGLDVQLLLNSMGDPSDRARYEPVVRSALASREDELCEDCLERLRVNPVRVFDCKVPECRDAVREEVPPITEYLGDASRAHFQRVQEILEGLGVAWKNVPELVRGIDYYTSTVFEYDLPAFGARSALGGGGRYDGLVAALGGPDLPGCGFGLGVEPTMIALKELRGEPQGWTPDVYVVFLSDELATVAMASATDLRGRGMRVSMSDEARSMRSQLRSADRSGARRAVILGPDEVARQVATVRDLASGEQEEVPLVELADRLADG